MKLCKYSIGALSLFVNGFLRGNINFLRELERWGGIGLLAGRRLTFPGKLYRIVGNTVNSEEEDSAPLGPAQRAAVWCEAEGPAAEDHLGAEG